MGGMMASPAPDSRNLDGPPPSPRANLASLPQGGAGAAGGSPQMAALEGLSRMEQGAQMLASSVPGLAPQLSQLIQGLRQAVPQAMAESGGGMGGGQAAGAVPMTAPPPAV